LALVFAVGAALAAVALAYGVGVGEQSAAGGCMVTSALTSAPTSAHYPASDCCGCLVIYTTGEAGGR